MTDKTLFDVLGDVVDRSGWSPGTWYRFPSFEELARMELRNVREFHPDSYTVGKQKLVFSRVKAVDGGSNVYD